MRPGPLQPSCKRNRWAYGSNGSKADFVPTLCQASIIGIAAINIPKQKIMNGRSCT